MVNFTAITYLASSESTNHVCFYFIYDSLWTLVWIKQLGFVHVDEEFSVTCENKRRETLGDQQLGFLEKGQKNKQRFRYRITVIFRHRYFPRYRNTHLSNHISLRRIQQTHCISQKASSRSDTNCCSTTYLFLLSRQQNVCLILVFMTSSGN